MQKDGNPFALDHSEEKLRLEGFYQCEAVISHAGRHFVLTSSYLRKARNEWWTDAPKRFWYIVALFAIITFAVPLYLQYCNKPIQKQPLIKPKTDSTTQAGLVK